MKIYINGSGVRAIKRVTGVKYVGGITRRTDVWWVMSATTLAVLPRVDTDITHFKSVLCSFIPTYLTDKAIACYH